MKVNLFLFFASNPFFDAYTQSDILGKAIFIWGGISCSFHL